MLLFDNLSRIYVNNLLNVEKSHQRHRQASIEKIEKMNSRIISARRVETFAHQFVFDQSKESDMSQ